MTRKVILFLIIGCIHIIGLLKLYIGGDIEEFAS